MLVLNSFILVYNWIAWCFIVWSDLLKQGSFQRKQCLHFCSFPEQDNIFLHPTDIDRRYKGTAIRIIKTDNCSCFSSLCFVFVFLPFSDSVRIYLMQSSLVPSALPIKKKHILFMLLCLGLTGDFFLSLQVFWSNLQFDENLKTDTKLVHHWWKKLHKIEI